VDLARLKPDIYDLIFFQCFDTVGLVILPVKLVPDMTCNVFGWTLNLTQLQLQWIWRTPPNDIYRTSH